MNVRGELTEKNYGRNAHRKYAIRGLERYLPSNVSVSVDVSVAAVLFFLLLLSLFFENKC